MVDNILSRVPALYITDALKTLPPAVIASEDSMEAQIAVPGIGNVRFTAKRRERRMGKAVVYFWKAEKAMVV